MPSQTKSTIELSKNSIRRRIQQAVPLKSSIINNIVSKIPSSYPVMAVLAAREEATMHHMISTEDTGADESSGTEYVFEVLLGSHHISENPDGTRSIQLTSDQYGIFLVQYYKWDEVGNECGSYVVVYSPSARKM